VTIKLIFAPAERQGRLAALTPLVGARERATVKQGEKKLFSNLSTKIVERFGLLKQKYTRSNINVQ
jgi:hypothetical protein